MSIHDDQVAALNAVVLRVRNEVAEAGPGTQFAKLKAALKKHCPPELIDAVAAIVNDTAAAVAADEKHDERRHERSMAKMDAGYRIKSGIVGFVFLVGFVVLSFFVPNPTEFQMSNLRLLRAVCGGMAFGGLTGTIQMQTKLPQFAIQATGAAAAAVIFYFWF